MNAHARVNRVSAIARKPLMQTILTEGILAWLEMHKGWRLEKTPQEAIDVLNGHFWKLL